MKLAHVKLVQAYKISAHPTEVARGEYKASDGKTHDYPACTIERLEDGWIRIVYAGDIGEIPPSNVVGTKPLLVEAPKGKKPPPLPVEKPAA